MCSLVLPILSAVNACRMRRRIGPPSLRSRAHAGHVPRNMRLALAGIDLLRPHVTAWLPSAAEQPPPGACIRMHWVVWGAIDIDETEGLWRQSASHSWMHVPFDRSVVGTFGSPIGGLPQLDAFAHDHAGGARPGIGRPHGREMLTRSQQSPGTWASTARSRAFVFCRLFVSPCSVRVSMGPESEWASIRYVRIHVRRSPKAAPNQQQGKHSRRRGRLGRHEFALPTPRSWRLSAITCACHQSRCRHILWAHRRGEVGSRGRRVLPGGSRGYRVHRKASW